MGKRIGVLIGLVLSIILVGWGTLTCASTELRLDREMNSWKARAQVAADAKDMAFYLGRLRQGMEENGMTEGQAALIFKTPDNDMALIFRVVVKAEKRAQLLATLPAESDAYQQGMDDLRGTLRELHTQIDGFYWRSHVGLAAFLITILSVLSWGLPLLGMAIGSSWDSDKGHSW